MKRGGMEIDFRRRSRKRGGREEEKGDGGWSFARKEGHCEKEIDIGVGG